MGEARRSLAEVVSDWLPGPRVLLVILACIGPLWMLASSAWSLYSLLSVREMTVHLKAGVPAGGSIVVVRDNTWADSSGQTVQQVSGVSLDDTVVVMSHGTVFEPFDPQYRFTIRVETGATGGTATCSVAADDAAPVSSSVTGANLSSACAQPGS